MLLSIQEFNEVMASVRMSDRLREELTTGFEKKFLLADPRPATDTSLAQVVLDALREHPAYQKTVAFISDPAVKDIVSRGGASSLKNLLTAMSATKIVRSIYLHGFKFNGSPQDFNIPLPTPATMYFASNWNESMDVHLDDFNDTAKAKLTAELTTRAQELLDWTKRYTDFMTAHKTLLKNCNTVGQLLEALPAAESLLSQEVQQKLNSQHKSAKDEAAAAARAAFDATQAAPVLLAAEIIGSATGEKQGS